MKRREFFKVSAAAVAGVLATVSVPFRLQAEEKRRGKKPGDKSSDMPLVDEASPQAKALNYKHDAAQVKDKALTVERAGVPFAKQHCENCSLFMGKPGDAQGGCSVFPGKAVKAKGWCSSWNKKV